MPKMFLNRKVFIGAIILSIILIGSRASFSEAMTSESYSVPSNVIDSFGSSKESSSYKLYDSGGQSTPAGTSESASYLVAMGFMYIGGGPAPTSAIQIPLMTGFNLFSLPVIPEDASINNVIGNKLEGLSARIYSYSPVTGWSIAYAQDGTWGGALTSIEADKGYWVKVSSAITLEVSGSASMTDRTIPLKGTKANLVGSAYDTSRTMDQTGLGTYLMSSDKVWGYVNNVWKPAYYDGSWHGALSSFEPGRGYWVIKNSSGDVSWTYPKP